MTGGGAVRLRLVDVTTGEDVPWNEVEDLLTVAEAELKSELDRVRAFRAARETEQLRPGLEVLDFRGVAEHGYDRTGPDLLRVEAVGWDEGEDDE